MDRTPEGYRKASQSATDAYFKALNEGGEIADGTAFDGQHVYVKDNRSSSSSGSSSKASEGSARATRVSGDDSTESAKS